MSRPHQHITGRQACSLVNQYAAHLPDLDQESAAELLKEMPDHKACIDCQRIIALHILGCSLCRTKFKITGFGTEGGTLKLVD